MRLVQSQAIIALPTGRPQKGGGIKKLAFALSLACLFAPASARAQNAYITNSGGFNWVTGSGNPGNTVSVIDTATNTVVGSPITVGTGPVAFGLFIQPVLVFSAHTRLTVYPNQQRFDITNSNFTLGASSNGINPPTEPVTLKIGSFKITIPPGSFVSTRGPGDFQFVGVIDNVQLVVSITLASPNKYFFAVEARNVSLTVSNPETITLTIGNESGTTTVNAVIINTG